MPNRLFEQLKTPPRTPFPAAMGYCCAESGLGGMEARIAEAERRCVPGAWVHDLPGQLAALPPEAAMTPGSMKVFLDRLVVRGIESPPEGAGLDLPESAAAMHPANPLAPWASAYENYACRLSWLISQGTHVAHVAVYDPRASLRSGTRGPAGSESLSGDPAGTIGRFLMDRQTAYRLLDDGLMGEASIGGGRIELRGEGFGAVVLPCAQHVQETTLDGLGRFVESGGLLIVMGMEGGDAPSAGSGQSWLDTAGYPGHPAVKPVGKGRVLRIREGLSPLARVLEDDSLSDTRLASPSPELKVLHRRGEHWELFFLVNESGRPQRVAGALRSLDPLVLLDLEAGVERRAVGVRDHCGGWTDFDWVFAPYESRTVAFCHHEGRLTGQVEERVAWRHVLTLDDWRFAGGGIETATRPRSWTELGLPYYSGEGTYRAEFDAEESPARILMDLGDVREVAVVSINGTEAGACPWWPYHVELTSRVVPGRNTLEVKVINSAVNKTRREERPAGLLGPVRLFTAD